MKEPEPSRLRRRAVSAESWDQGETILHALTAAVTFLSPDRRVIWMNQRGLKILGLSPGKSKELFALKSGRIVPSPVPIAPLTRSSAAAKPKRWS